MSWPAPAWMPATAALVRRRPLACAAGVVAAAVLAVAGTFGGQW
jgi:alpha-2-macroglobulin